VTLFAGATGFLRTCLERMESASLGTEEFTAALPLRAGASHAELRALLGEMDAREPSPFADVPGLHSVRFILLDQADEGASSVDVPAPSGPLLITCVLDGDPGDVLRAMVVGVGETLRQVLDFCEGFPFTADTSAILRFLTAARVRSGYFFSDVADTRDEIRHALSLEQRFRAFYARHGAVGDAAVLRAAFEDWKRKGGPRSPRHSVVVASTPSDAPPFAYPFDLSPPFERAVPQEGKWVRRVVELTRRLQQHDVEEARETDARARPKRVAHTKHHGCLEATFTVEQDVPRDLRHGVFQPGSVFNALLRCSNTSNVPRPDGKFDGRGLSIKLLNVGAYGRPVLPEPAPDGLGECDRAPGSTQDFLLLNHPAFFAKDIHDFAILRSILDVGTSRERAARALLFILRRPHQFRIFFETFFTTIDHPLEPEFHSTVPSLLGPRLAVKYSVQRAEGTLDRAPKCSRENSNYLCQALQASLDPQSGHALELEFFVHVATDRSFPIEDATSNWEELGARKVKVATIRIEPQRFDTPERMALCEGLVFTPWHALQAHKPLGSLSRARWAIYKASMDGRRAQAKKRDTVAGAA
jgi:hypothetical protein